jgi:SAM-dependent methyltransferase
MGMLNSVTLAKRYLQWQPVEPPDIYTSGNLDDRSSSEYADERSENGFHNIFSLDLRDKDVLDLGCGYGGRTVHFKELGARSVTGVEIREDIVRQAVAFGASRGVSITALAGFGEQIPLANDSVDVITTYDVFEHVESLPRTLAECFRVLRPGGVLYAVFPPFYHPTGGSHLHGYISNSPLPNLLFTCRALRRAIDEILDTRGSAWRPYDRPTDALPAVNGTTIAGFLKMLDRVPFQDKKVRLDPLKSETFWWLNGLPALGTKIPFMREVCTSRIECILRK